MNIQDKIVELYNNFKVSVLDEALREKYRKEFIDFVDRNIDTISGEEKYIMIATMRADFYVCNNDKDYIVETLKLIRSFYIYKRNSEGNLLAASLENIIRINHMNLKS